MGSFQSFSQAQRSKSYSMGNTGVENKRPSLFSGQGSVRRSERKDELRTGVGKPGQTGFTVDPDTKRKSHLTHSKVSYASTLRSRKSKVRHKRSENTTFLIKFAWIVCAVLMVRLIVMDRGAIDYYQMASLLQQKKEYLVYIHQENESLEKEIEKIQSSPTYQKKLARDHLSVIADDEYLVLFAREQELSAK